jgi:hypothetical protein
LHDIDRFGMIIAPSVGYPNRRSLLIGHVPAFGEALMRLVDGRYECALCGEKLDVPFGAVPTVVLHAASGRPNTRVLCVDGVEVHRCNVTGEKPAIGISTSSGLRRNATGADRR